MWKFCVSFVTAMKLIATNCLKYDLNFQYYVFDPKYFCILTISELFFPIK